MSDFTTIQIDKELVQSMRELREYPRQTYNELIAKMIKIFKATKQNKQYDEFLHQIQRQSMTELWDNKEDEVWDNV